MSVTRAGRARPRCPRRRRARSARTAPPSTTARRACAARRRGARRLPVGVTARVLEGAPERERRLPRDRPLADPDRRQQPRPPGEVARRRRDRAVEGDEPPRPDRRAREDRHRSVAASPPDAAGERVAAAPGAVRAQRREPHRVGLGAEAPPARGDRRLGQEGVERGLVLPDREQRPAAQVGRQRHRAAAAGAQQPPERRPGVRASAGRSSPMRDSPSGAVARG